MHVHGHGADLDTALAALPTAYHQSLPCSITQIPSDPGVACAARPAQPCWMRTSYTFHLNGMYEPEARFEPDFVWALQGEAPAIEIRGGECASCSFPYRGRSFTYLGLCLRARLKLAHSASQTSVVGVRCIKSADQKAQPLLNGTRPRNLVLGVFSGYHGIWQHQLINGLPHWHPNPNLNPNPNHNPDPDPNPNPNANLSVARSGPSPASRHSTPPAPRATP